MSYFDRLHTISLANTNIYAGTFTEAEATLEAYHNNLSRNQHFVGNMECTRDNLDELIKIVEEIDWTVWHDLYNDSHNRHYEFTGYVVCDTKFDEDYCAIITHKGDKGSTKVAGYGKYINIHSHPINYIINSNKIGTSNIPSREDFIHKHGTLNLLVTMLGVIIYGAANSVVDISDDIDSLDNYRHLIVKFISWEELGYREHDYYYKHHDGCKIIGYESAFESNPDDHNLDIVYGCNCDFRKIGVSADIYCVHLYDCNGNLCMIDYADEIYYDTVCDTNGLSEAEWKFNDEEEDDEDVDSEDGDDEYDDEEDNGDDEDVDSEDEYGEFEYIFEGLESDDE